MLNSGMDDTEIRLACGNLARTRELIRSLRDDEQVKSQPGSASGCVLMTRASGRSIIHGCDVFEDVLSNGCSRCNVPVGTIHCSSQRSANEATSHDGSFDHWNVHRGLVEGWKRHHAYSPSRSAENQLASENHRHPPNCPGWIRVPTRVWGPAA